MPDGFELSQNLDPLNSNDANYDPDFDSLTNLEEYQLGKLSLGYVFSYLDVKSFHMLKYGLSLESNE